MADKQPTEVQIKELWEWCGFEQNTTYGEGQFYNYPDGGSSRLPELDLNDLFKYAMVQLDQAQYYKALKSIFVKQDDPALALFWAIWQVIK